MAITRVAERANVANSAADPHVVTLASGAAITVGNHLILRGVWDPTSVTSPLVGITDSVGNTWQIDAEEQSSTSTFAFIASCKVENAYSNGSTISLDFDSSQVGAFVVDEYSGLAASGWLDTAQSGTAAGVSGTAFDTGAGITPSQAATLLIGVTGIGGSGSVTPTDGSWTARGNNTTSGTVRGVYTYDEILSSSATRDFDGTISASRQWVANIACYKAASGSSVTIAASITVQSGASGTIAQARPIAGAAAAVSSASATLESDAVEIHLAASITVTSGASAALAQARPVAGTAAAVSTAAATASVDAGIELIVGGTSFIDYLTSRSPKVKNTAYQQTGVFSFQLQGPPDELIVTVEDEVLWKDSGVRLYAGFVRNIRRSDLDRAGHIFMDVDCQDYTTLLGDDIVDVGGLREVTSESDAERIEWLLDTFGSKGITVGAEVQELRATMPTVDYTGMSLAAALADIAKLTGGSWYVDYSKVLHYFASEADAAPFGLSDEPDDVSTFGYKRLLLPDDSVGLRNAVYVIGDGIASWYTDDDSITAYGRREASIKDERVSVQATLDSMGAAFLAENAHPRRAGSLQTYAPGLRAGMEVQITSADHGLVGEAYRIASVETSYDTDELPVYTVNFGDEPITAGGQAASTSSAVAAVAAQTSGIAGQIADLSAAGANMVPNSSFESGSTGSWTVGSQWAFGHASGEPFAGTKTARVAPTGTNTGELVTSDYIAVARDDDWHVSFWSYVTSFTAGTARARLREYDASNNLLASTDIDITAAEAAWTRHSLHFGPNDVGRIPFHADTVKVKVVFYVFGSPTLAWEVDGVQVERGKLLTAYAPRPQELIDGQIGPTQISDDAITTPKLAALAVVAGKIAAGAITTEKLDALAVIANVINAGGTVTIDSSGILITDGVFEIRDLGGATVMTGAGFSGGWRSFIRGGIYNGDFVNGSGAVVAAATIVSGADSQADYEASLSPDIPSWIVTDPGNDGIEQEGGATSFLKFIDDGAIMQDVPIQPGQRYALAGLIKAGSISLIGSGLRYADHTELDSGSTYSPSGLLDGDGTNWKPFTVNLDEVVSHDAPPPAAAFMRLAIEASGFTTITGLKLIPLNPVPTQPGILTASKFLTSSGPVSVGNSDTEYDSDFRVTWPGHPDMKGLTAVLRVWCDLSNTWGADTDEFNVSIMVESGTAVNGPRITFTRNQALGGDWVQTFTAGQVLVADAASPITFKVMIRRPAGASNFTGYGHASAVYVSRLGYDLVGYI